MWDADELLVLPDPARLEEVSLTEDGAAEALRGLPGARDAQLTLRALLPHAAAARARRGRRGEAPAGLSLIEREYDAYFGVRRDRDDAPRAVFHDAVLIAYAQLLDESLRGPPPRPIEFGLLCAALEDLLHRSARPGGAPAADAEGALAPAPLTADVAALRRWRRGHHVFFVLIAGLVITHGALRRCLEAGDEAGARGGLRLATDLWWAAAAALPFAGDLPPGSYESVIRPSMQPPHTSREFSGLHSADHAVLIRQLRGLRDRMAALPEALVTQHHSYLRSLRVVYQSHAAVCEHFVGRQPSLVGRRTHARPAPEVLRTTLQQRTLALAGA